MLLTGLNGNRFMGLMEQLAGLLAINHITEGGEGSDGTDANPDVRAKETVRDVGKKTVVERDAQRPPEVGLVETVTETAFDGPHFPPETPPTSVDDHPRSAEDQVVESPQPAPSTPPPRKPPLDRFGGGIQVDIDLHAGADESWEMWD